MALLLSGSMVIGNVLPAAAASKKKDDKNKVETVYVNANAEGDADKITVSEQLKSSESGSIEDYSELKNIKNVKGDEEFTQNSDGSLTWTSVGEDIYYQGESDASLPVSVKVTYYLDGKQISPDDLAGKSGKVKIRFDYTNHTSDTVKVDKKNITVQTPFTVVSAMILPVDNFSNIEVENGRAVSDGERNIIIGMAMPGLRDSLKLSDYDKLSDIDIPEYVEVTADATDFELSMTATMATTGTIGDIDLDSIDDLDDLKEDMDDLTDASSKLVDGSGKLLDGMNTLSTSLGQYTKGVSAVDKGAGQLKDGLSQLANNKDAFEDGAEGLTKGIRTLKNGTKTLNKGIKAYTDGAAGLEKGIQSASSGSAALKTGAASLSKGLKEYTDGADKIQKGLAQLNSQMSKVSMPSDEQMKAVSEAAAKLNKDAQELQKQTEALIKLMTSLSNLDKLLSDYKTDVESWVGTAAGKIYASANEKANAQIGKQTGDVEGKVKEKIEGAQSSANDSIGKAVSAGNKASEDTKAKIKAAVNAMELDEEAKKKVLAEIEGVSAETISAENYKVGLDSKVDVDISVEIKPDAELVGALAKDFPSMDIKAPEVNADQLKGLLEDMAKQAKVLEGFSANVGGLADKIPELKGAIDQLDSGAKALTKNNDDLVKGMGSLSKGIDSLNQGLGQLKTGAAKLTANNKTITGGASSLDDGAGKLLTGSTKMERAVKQVTKAAGLLATGSIQLKDGTGKLAGAGGQINSGVGKLVGGMGTLNDGFVKFDEEGIQKIADLAGDDLQSVTTQIKAVKKADNNYQSYGGIRKGDKGSVKFIIETAAIEKDDE